MKKSILLSIILLSLPFVIYSQSKAVPDDRWDDQFIISNAPNDTVRAIASDGVNVYVGGDFTSVGALSANYIAMWDGSAWSALGTGLNGIVRTIEVEGGNVYVGGDFSLAGGSTANYIAVWDGTTWNEFGGGMNGSIHKLYFKDGYLYAGGDFSMAGAVSANRITKWDGTTWTAFGTGADDIVCSISVSGTDMYIGGEFTSVGGVSNTDHIAWWNGSSWSSMGTGTNGVVYDIIANSGSVYAAGDYTNIGGVAANNFAKWDGSNWYAIGTGTNGPVFDLEDDGGDIYLGGDFTSCDGTTTNYAALYNGVSWAALGSGLDDRVYKIDMMGYEFYLGGGFLNAASYSSNYFGKWMSPPVITTQPIAQNACLNDTVTFVIDVDGTAPFTYQWQFGGSDISGAVDSFYTIQGVTPINAGNYKCVVMNAADTISSNTATLTIHQPPTVNVDPIDQEDCEGESVNFSISATSTTPLSYQWLHDGSEIVGETNNTLTISSIALADSGAYSCIAINTCGSDTSEVALLTVNPIPTAYFTGLSLNYCINDMQDTLQPIPSGGVFSGSGMTDSIFDPAGLIGTFTITYTYTDIHGCTDVYDMQTEVHGIPAVSFSGLASEYCLSSLPSTLTGSPSGGNFYGNGISGDIFYPDSSSVGIQEIVYIYSDSYGCTNSDTNSTLIHDIPNIDVGADTNICIGEPLTITMTGDFGMYGWYFTPTVNTSIVVNPVTDTSYVGWIMSSFGCLNIDTINVNVHPIPQNVSFTGLDSVYCATGQPDTLVGYPSGGEYISMAVNDSIFFPNYLAPGQYEVVYMYTDSNQCSNYDTAAVEIKPVMSVSFTGIDYYYCANGEADTLSGTPYGGTYIGAGITDSIFNPTAAGVGYHQILYSYPDTNGCIAYDTAYADVVELPTLIVPLDTGLCFGDSIALIAQIDTGANIIWSVGSNNDTVYVTPFVATSYTVTVSNGVCLNSDTVMVDVYEMPVVDLGADRDMCMYQSLNAGGGGMSYEWLPNLSSDSILILESGGNYAVTVTSFDGCEASDDVTITILPTPVIDLGPDFTITQDQTTLLGAGGNYNSYLWNTGETNSIIVIEGDSLTVGPHEYWVVAENANGCSDTDTITITVNYGLGAEDLQLSKISVYPVPVHDILNVDLDMISDYEISITDMLGKKVHILAGSDDFVEIDVRNLRPGVYFIEVESGFGRYQRKIVKK
jgi:hypothetical protein